MSSHTDHVTTETVFGVMLALWLGNGDKHRALESDMTGLNVKGNLYLYVINKLLLEIKCSCKGNNVVTSHLASSLPVIN